MNGKTHAVLGGIACVVCGASGFMCDPLLGVVGALLPDVDHPKAIAGKFLPVWAFGVKHRSRVTHSWIPLAVLTLITVTAGWNWGLVVGYASHLLADSLTPSGVPIWGHKNRRYRFLIFPTSRK